MSEDNRDNEEKLNEEEAVDTGESAVDEGEDTALVESDEMDEVDEFEEDETDEMEETEQEVVPEVGACLVLGQGDASMALSNRGADDPGDNTLCEPQFITRYGDYFFVSDRGNHRVTRSRMMALASSASANRSRAAARPAQPSSHAISAAKPLAIWPPLRPEAPQPTRLASRTATR